MGKKILIKTDVAWCLVGIFFFAIKLSWYKVGRRYEIKEALNGI